MKLSHPFHSAATAELLAAMDWYEGERPGLGLEFWEAVDQALRTGVLLPLPDRGPGSPYRRYLVERFPYSLIVRLRGESERPLVLAVAHQSRDPDYWTDRNGATARRPTRRRRR